MADFDDEDAVLGEVARALKIDPDDLQIGENRGLTGFGAGTVYEITIVGGRTGKEWSVVEDDDQMRELALEVVKQDLEQEPEIFTQSWLEDFVDKDRLRRDLESDVMNMAMDDLSDQAGRDPESFWQQAEQWGMDAPEEDLDDEDWEWPEPSQSDIEELAEKITDDQLKDPMQYLEGIYGDEAAQKAIEIAGIDIDAAAEDAVDTDGAEHFLARYDGNYYETKSGFVYWRDN